MPAIKIKNLKKSYGGIDALKGINMTIDKGQFFGLLGPNGAGKTTTINILTGLVRKDMGETMIFNRDTVSNYRFTRKQVGISSQEFTQDWFFPLDKLLLFQAGYYGLSYNESKERTEIMLEQFGLTEKRNNSCRELSGGMKRRLQIAKALIHNPDILILDEPDSGLDIKAQNDLNSIILKQKKLNNTVLFTTHNIEKAIEIGDRIGIINKGKIINISHSKNFNKNLIESIYSSK